MYRPTWHLKPPALRPAYLGDDMNKPLSILAILVLITLGSVCGLYIYHDDTRSDITALTPYNITDYNASGSLDIGGEFYPYVLAEAMFGVDLVDDGKSHCWTTISFSHSNFGPYNILEFDYWTMKDTQAPEGSVRTFMSGNESRYVYDDPLTGTELTFHLVDNIVDMIVYRGTTVNEFDEKFEYVSFEIEASFDNRSIVYVNNVIEGKLPEALNLCISGEENGKAMNGVLRIDPLSCTIWDGGYKTVIASVTLDIPGTSLPDSIVTAIVRLNDGYGFSKQSSHIQYLDQEGNYIEQNIIYRLSDENEFSLVLEGTVMSSVLDSECNIIEQTVFEFDYGVV